MRNAGRHCGTPRSRASGYLAVSATNGSNARSEAEATGRIVHRAMDHVDVRPRCQLAYGRLAPVGCLHGQVYKGFKPDGYDHCDEFG